MNQDEQPGLSEKDIIRRLQNMELQDVPSRLTSRIMLQIEKRSESLLSRFWKAFTRSYTLSYRPLHAFTIALVICGAFVLGRTTIEEGKPPVSAQFSILDEMLKAREDAQSAYLIGRGLLEAKHKEEALALLNRAAVLEPSNPEYAYWEGIGYWSVGARDQERNSYQRGLSVSPESIPLLTNLGHSFLSEGRYEQALEAYHSVLTIEPDHPTSIYNSGLILRQLGRTRDEIEAWKTYLDSNRAGKWAFRAVGHLNGYGDFSYRSYLVGARKFIVSPEALFDETRPADERYAELRGIARMLDADQKLQIEVIVFTENDRDLARRRSLMIRDMLAQLTESDTTGRIGLSWFDSPDQVLTGNTVQEISESLWIFNRNSIETRKEETI